MSNLQFIASLVASLAWPVTLCLLLAALHGPLLNAFRGLAVSKISVAGTTVEFDQQGREVAALVSVAAGADNEAVGQLAPKNVAVILATWKELEDAVRARLEVNGISSAALLDGEGVVDVASKRGLLTNDQANSLRGLLTMRNLAVHSREGDITDARVTEFVVLATAMKTVLQMTDRDIGAEVGGHTAAAIQGQGELATLNYQTIKDRLVADFPILKT